MGIFIDGCRYGSQSPLLIPKDLALVSDEFLTFEMISIPNSKTNVKPKTAVVAPFKFHRFVSPRFGDTALFFSGYRELRLIRKSNPKFEPKTLSISANQKARWTTQNLVPRSLRKLAWPVGLGSEWQKDRSAGD